MMAGSARYGAFARMLILAAVLPAACGKKGPPSPPLRVVPDKAGGLEVRQVGDRVILMFDRPAARSDGSPLDPATRLDIHLAAGVTAQIEAEAIVENPAASWSIPLSEWDAYDRAGRLRVPIGVGSVARALGLGTGSGALVGRRIGFVVEAAESPRRRSAPSGIAAVTVCAPPDPPAGVGTEVIPEGTRLTWTPQAEGRVAVYRRDPGAPRPGAAAGEAPASAGTFLDTAPPAGAEVEYRLGSERRAGCESALSDPVIATWIDRFAPATPDGLVAVEEEGAIRLFWRPGRDPDLAGYLVYRARGEEPFERMTPAPITVTTWTDADAQPGTAYTYVVTTVDGAVPPNESPRSEPARAERPR